LFKLTVTANGTLTLLEICTEVIRKHGSPCSTVETRFNVGSSIPAKERNIIVCSNCRQGLVDFIELLEAEVEIRLEEAEKNKDHVGVTLFENILKDVASLEVVEEAAH
jgi:hypothetical protein